jgi:uncharacterized SAM-binding protein YcdF (DUF218 family)/transcriptional regulator with XRE-family HTH domain
VKQSVASSFGEALRALMGERDISGNALARRVPCDSALISRYVNGKQDPSRRMAQRLDEALGAEGSLVALVPSTPAGRSARPVQEQVQIVPSGPASLRVTQALDVIDNDHLGGVADSLSALVDHYAQTICALPPARVYDELVAVRSRASEIIERSGHGPRRADLVLLSGWLSSLLAVAATDMREHAAARVWCSDAERRSQESRHPELAAWAVLTRAMIAYYQGQPHHAVTLAAQGQSTVPVGTVIHAKLAALEMRAAAMAGDADRMTQARRHAAKAITALPAGVKTTGVFSIPLSENPPYTATAERYHCGLAPLVITTGGVNRHNAIVEGREFRRSLIDRGVPDAAIRFEDQSANTWQNVEFALPFLSEALRHGLPVTAVCKWYHRRAVHALKTLVPDIGAFYVITWNPVYSGRAVTRTDWPVIPDGRRRVVREWEEVPRRVSEGSFKDAQLADGAWR